MLFFYFNNGVFMSKITAHQLLVIALGTMYFGDGVKRGRFEDMPRHTASRELLEKFAVNLQFAFKDRLDVGIAFPTEANSEEWRKCFKILEDGTFICKKSRLNEVWQSYRELNLFYPMTLVRRILYKTRCELYGCAEEDYDAF